MSQKEGKHRKYSLTIEGINVVQEQIFDVLIDIYVLKKFFLPLHLVRNMVFGLIDIGVYK